MSTSDFRLVPCQLPGAHAVVASSTRALARHMHEQFGIGVIERGGQLSHSGRGQVEAGPNDIITVNPGEVHDGIPVGDSGRSWRILYFEPSVVARAALDLREGAGGDFELTQPVVRNRRAGALVRQFFAAATSKVEPLRLEELLLATLAAVGAGPRAADGSKMRPEVERARAVIDADPTVAITLADLAVASGLGRFQLLRGFAQAIGLTPHAYILQRRVELARRLVDAGEPLADAAIASGFSDQSHMTRAFASRFGLTPGAYAAATR
jgi:AraC-like DNA-binding protein